MYNADIPARAGLPTTGQLLRSTIIAVAAAAVILVTVILPAEYAIDPTGIGRALKLTQMGAIKNQLAIEAEADRRRGLDEAPRPAAAPDRRSGLFDGLRQLLVSPAAASDRTLLAQVAKSDVTTFTLQPNEGVEYKMTMTRGAKAQYSWQVEGGVVNYDLHGTPGGGGKETSYKTGRGVGSDTGVLAAAYDGSHGWFWRNRGARDVTITLTTSGDYSDIRKMK